MPKINKEEYQVLKGEDEEPYNIAELIEEYENSPEYVTYISNERTRILSNDLWSKLESEETEVKKDIEWLKGKLESLKETDLRMWKQSEPNSKSQSHFNGSMAAIDKVLDFLDQLDEPEVLSSDWISENVEYAYFDMLDGSGRLSSATAIIKPEKLQNLLVPKLEKVDKAYKEGYDIGKEHGYEKGYSVGVSNNTHEPEFTIYDAHDKIREESTLTDKSFDYYWNCIADGVEMDEPGNLLVPKQEVTIGKEDAENIVQYKEMGWTLSHLINDYGEDARHDELLAKAWLAYPNIEVEKEQKYYALIKGHENIYSDICFWIYDTKIEELLIDNAEIYPDVTAGYMIKATKDEWANLGINDDNADFVKVEELEE